MQEEGESAHLKHYKVLMSPPLNHESVIGRRGCHVLITVKLCLLHLAELFLDSHLDHPVGQAVQSCLHMDVVLVVLDSLFNFCARNILIFHVVQTN